MCLIVIIVLHSHYREIHYISFLPQPSESLENNVSIESSDEENDDLRLGYMIYDISIASENLQKSDAIVNPV